MNLPQNALRTRGRLLHTQCTGNLRPQMPLTLTQKPQVLRFFSEAAGPALSSQEPRPPRSSSQPFSTCLFPLEMVAAGSTLPICIPLYGPTRQNKQVSLRSSPEKAKEGKPQMLIVLNFPHHTRIAKKLKVAQHH